MSNLGNAFPVRSKVPDVVRVQGTWTGGGSAADCTVTDGDWNRGIASFVYNSATGKYKITFQEWGQQIMDYSLKVEGTTGVDPVHGQVVAGTFDNTLGTVEVEFGATLIDLLTTNKIHLTFEFAKNAP